MGVIEGCGYGAQLTNAGAPVNGTDEVQTLTLGGTPTGGSFKIKADWATTAAIPWSATNATLLASINAALNALPNIGSAGVVATAGTLTAGIGTILITFSGTNFAKKAITFLMTVPDNSLTGTTPTAVITESTPGVDATARGAAVGGVLLDTTNKIAYQNNGNSINPTWQKIGVQT